MADEIKDITQPQSDAVASIGEGQFSEVKAKEIASSRLSKTISAFANTDGGDLYVGIDEFQAGGGVKQRRWNGFEDVEAATSFLQMFNRLSPLGSDFQYEFLRCNGREGLVLHVQIRRTQQIVFADDGLPYIRIGASSNPVSTPEGRKRLEYIKGIASFETELVNAPKEVMITSPVTRDFIRFVVPTQEPEAWLRKQGLIRDSDKPTVGGLLLFSEEPQAAIPKHCGVKIYRYKTSEKEGFRDVLAFDPLTIEGDLYHQIRAAVSTTIEIVESIPKMGELGLETVRYPRETLHEIITNAVIHRDYSIADDVHIRIFDNRIEIQSPGRFPAHVTPKNFLSERFARNGAVVRLLNKFPDPPNKDVGEGLNTAFAKMNELGLKDPELTERGNDVLVVIKHEPLASPEETIMRHLESNPSIKNAQARELTGVKMDYQMKAIFSKMEQAGLIEQIPGTRTSSTAYRRVIKSDEA